MRKFIFIFILTLFLNPFSIDAFASEIYETKKFNLPKSSEKDLIDSNGLTKKEVKSDILGMNSLFYLQPKTTSNFEIAIANDDGTFSYLSKADTLNDALNFINKQKGTDILSIINENGQVVYSTYSVGRVIKFIDGKPITNNSKISNVYSDSSLKTAHTYVNHGYIDDVPIIEDKGTSAKVMISGYTGWMNKNAASNDFDLTIVPINQVKNPSHYYVKSGVLYHFVSSDILSNSKSGYSLNIGPAPSYLKPDIKYYSYDGKFFFKSLKELITALKTNSYKSALNYTSPFYSYYLNLPFRSKTNYSTTELNSFINKNAPSNSKLKNTGKFFIDAQNKYGMNALLALGLAINESAFGTSNIALEKNNLFGLGAIDSSPGQSANYFKSIELCINEFANHHISKTYANPNAWQYYGGNFGNKNLGANVKYASDPYWGEKASHHAFKIDQSLSNNSLTQLKDFNHYQLAIHTSNNSIITREGSTLYKAKSATPMIVVDNRDYSISNSKQIRILPDRPISSTDNFNGIYLWNIHGYTPKEKLSFINKGKYNLLFTDIQGHFAQNVIEKFAHKGFIVGYKDGSFKPNSPITRAEFVKLVNLTFNYTLKGNESFIDVNKNDWFYEQVKIAVHYGYISSSLDKFRPNDSITREEAAAILTALTNTRDTNLDKLSKYTDKNKVAKWAQSSVEGCLEKSFMGQGSLEFRPKFKLTRAEAVAILDRLPK